MSEFLAEFLASCWAASVIATFILTHKFTARASQREIDDLRGLVHKLHTALFANQTRQPWERKA